MSNGKDIKQSILFGSELPQSSLMYGADLFELKSQCFSRPCVCVIGVFDGFHKGHQKLLAIAQEEAYRINAPLIAITFVPDPAEVLFDTSPRRLLTSQERVKALALWGVDGVVVHHFTKEFSQLSATKYIEDVLLKLIKPASVHVGSNFSLGSHGSKGVDFLQLLGKKHHFQVTAHQLFCHDGEKISATKIRTLLEQGHVQTAAELLGRWYFLSGTVRHGRGQGTGFGFPTANVILDNNDCIPKDGVYACYVVQNNKAWPAAVNVGTPPTFEVKPTPLLEANLLGFEGNLYDSEIKTVFVRHLRSSKKFDSLEELKEAVHKNIDWVAQNLGTTSVTW